MASVSRLLRTDNRNFLKFTGSSGLRHERTSSVFDRSRRKQIFSNVVTQDMSVLGGAMVFHLAPKHLLAVPLVRLKWTERKGSVSFAESNPCPGLAAIGVFRLPALIRLLAAKVSGMQQSVSLSCASRSLPRRSWRKRAGVEPTKDRLAALPGFEVRTPHQGRFSPRT
jgi:hypothetical protein